MINSEESKSKESVKELIKRCEKYRNLTKKALKKAKLVIPENSALYDISKDFIEMAKNYLSDGEHYQKQGKYDIALASFAYAHAWLDASARIGFIDVKKDNKLFTLYKW